MDIIRESYVRLFSSRTFPYKTNLYYNRRLSDFNANISLHGRILTVKMNLQWKNIDDEIKIGLIQSLLVKVFCKSKKKSTLNIELYNDFVKKIPDFFPKDKSDPHLEKVFHRVNDNLFGGTIEKTNLAWGTYSTRKLASYNFHNDTITVSKVFRESSPRVLDLLMYHEMLHKKYQFETSRKGRHNYHTSKFKKAESMFFDKDAVEKEIDQEIRKFRLNQPKKPKQTKPTKKKFNWFG
jgi:hypothetical protein